MTYIVQPGDSLFKIALKFNLTIPEIKSANNLTGDLIYIGQHLYIPLLPDGIYGIGSQGDAVRQIQQVLSIIGYPINVDGIYGPQTADIIYNIQLKFPELAADGIYGPQTKRILRQLLGRNYRIVQNPTSLLALVNKNNALHHYYTPNDLVVPNVPFTFEEFAPQKQLRSEASQALEELFAKANQENIDLTAISGFRSYARQAEIFRRNWLASPEQANRLSARPGESEHQTGLSMDVSSPTVNYSLVEYFANTPEGQWLAENAPEFGFIIRFPQGKEHITGYQYEPWHLRYVGKIPAKEITQANITLEEYLGMA